MQPIYPWVSVEKVEDNESGLVQTVEEHPVVRVVLVPAVPLSEPALKFHEGNKILVNHVDEYMVNGEMLYFIRVSDIVSIV